MQLQSQQSTDHGVLSYALGPLINRKRAASVLRVRFTGSSFTVEHLVLGKWGPIASMRTYNEAMIFMHQTNQKALAKRKLTLW